MNAMQEFIETRLRQAFPDATFELCDTTGGGDHFRLDIASQRFDGLTVLQQHRLVYGELGEGVGREIHALALTTRTKTNGTPR